MLEKYTKIEGSFIRKELERMGMGAGLYKVCCGGARRYNKNYADQLRKLGKRGNFTVTENGIIVARIVV